MHLYETLTHAQKQHCASLEERGLAAQWLANYMLSWLVFVQNEAEIDLIHFNYQIRGYLDTKSILKA